MNRKRAAVLDQLADVGALEWVAAGEHQHAAELLDAPHQGLALFGG